MAIKKSFVFAILTIGITSIVSQIILLRELISVFYGNELSIGIILASWLLLGAVGSFAVGWSSDRIVNHIPIFCISLLCLSAILPCTIFLIGSIKHFFGLLPGEMAPLSTLLISSPVIIAPVCVILGFLFTLSCKIFPAKDPSLKIGYVYILESAGAAIGGLLTSFVLIKYFSPLEILTGLALVNIAACFAMAHDLPASKSKAFIKIVSCFCVITIGILASTGRLTRLEELNKEETWKPFKLLASADSIYGKVAVAKRGAQISLFTNGLHNFTVPDKLSREEAIHLPFSQHRDPKDILLIGGGAGGLLGEILKYPVNRIHYIELDPLVIDLSRKYLSGPERRALDNPKVNIINMDGRFFIKTTTSRFDIIVIHLPGPHTAQLNRFYTRDFFLESKKKMKEGGILSFGLTSSENYISSELADFLGSINNTLKSVFDDVVIVPGDTAYFIAGKKKGALSLDPYRISEELERREIDTGFVSRGYLLSKLSRDRLDYIKHALANNKKVGLNLDFRPISYYYDMVLWSAHFGSRLRKLPKFLSGKVIWAAFSLSYILIIFAGWISRKKRRYLFGSILTAIGITGFSEMVFEIVVILSFQIIYGFLYYKLGLLLTSFMVGLLAGSIHITKRLDKLTDPVNTFTKIQVSVVVYPFILPAVFLFVSQNTSPFLSWLGYNIIFPTLPIIAGFIGGLQFPLGNKIYLKKALGPGRTGGMIYGIDLIGACLGAMVVSTILIPIIGIFQTCAAVGLLNLSVLINLLLQRRADAD